jgi:hypothetical protein
MASIYVDISLDSNTGTGTTVDPYGRLAYAFATASVGTTGDTFYVRGAGTLASSLTIAGWGLFNKPVHIAQWPGQTQAVIDCNGSAMFASAPNYASICGLHLKNGASGGFVVNGNLFGAIGCYVYDSAGGGISAQSNGAYVENCRVENVSGIGISVGSNASVTGNYVASGGTRSPSTGIACVFESSISRNIVYLTSSGTAISAQRAVVAHNTVLSTHGGGFGIRITLAQSLGNMHANLVEGWTSGTGIDLSAGYHTRSFNAVCRASTAYNGAPLSDIDNETFADGTVLAKSGAATWANRRNYFSPVSRGNVLASGGGGAFGFDKGALPEVVSGGGVSGFTGLSGVGRLGT